MVENRGIYLSTSVDGIIPQSCSSSSARGRFWQKFWEFGSGFGGVFGGTFLQGKVRVALTLGNENKEEFITQEYATNDYFGAWGLLGEITSLRHFV